MGTVLFILTLFLNVHTSLVAESRFCDNERRHPVKAGTPNLGLQCVNIAPGDTVLWLYGRNDTAKVIGNCPPLPASCSTSTNPQIELTRPSSDRSLLTFLRPMTVTPEPEVVQCKTGSTEKNVYYLDVYEETNVIVNTSSKPDGNGHWDVSGSVLMTGVRTSRRCYACLWLQVNAKSNVRHRLAEELTKITVVGDPASGPVDIQCAFRQSNLSPTASADFYEVVLEYRRYPRTIFVDRTEWPSANVTDTYLTTRTTTDRQKTEWPSANVTDTYLTTTDRQKTENPASPTHDCPDVIAEGESLTCQCLPDGTPSQTVRWNSLDDQRLTLKSVSRQDNGTVFTCCDTTGACVNYVLLVAYGPSQAYITTESVNRTACTLTCMTADAYPTPIITWTRVGTNQVLAGNPKLQVNVDDLGKGWECEAKNEKTNARVVSPTVQCLQQRQNGDMSGQDLATGVAIGVSIVVLVLLLVVVLFVVLCIKGWRGPCADAKTRKQIPLPAVPYAFADKFDNPEEAIYTEIFETDTNMPESRGHSGRETYLTPCESDRNFPEDRNLPEDRRISGEETRVKAYEKVRNRLEDRAGCSGEETRVKAYENDRNRENRDYLEEETRVKAYENGRNRLEYRARCSGEETRVKAYENDRTRVDGRGDSGEETHLKTYRNDGRVLRETGYLEEETRVKTCGSGMLGERGIPEGASYYDTLDNPQNDALPYVTLQPEVAEVRHQASATKQESGPLYENKHGYTNER